MLATRFVHTQLKHQGSIRLVRFDVEESSTIVSCEIIDVNLGSPALPSYNALSYTWGTSSERTDILLNGQRFGVSSTLCDFLVMFAGKNKNDISLSRKHFRSLKDKVQALSRHTRLLAEKEILDKELELSADYLWIDQLCIDQDNDGEKSHQVAMMAQIYQTAANVVVWLDDRYPSADVVKGALERDKSRNMYWELNEKIDWSQGGKRTCLWRPEALMLETAAAIAIFEHPYWQRLWVVQELMLAPSTTIYFGDYELSKETLRWCCNVANRAMENHGYDTAKADTTLWSLADVTARDRSNGIEPLETITTVFSWFMDHDCRDPRDKVYGLLALAETSIVVDYTKSVEDVFWDAVVEFEEELLESVPTRLSAEDADQRSISCETQVRDVLRLARAMMPDRSQLRGMESREVETAHAQALVASWFSKIEWPAHESSGGTEFVRRVWRETLRSFISNTVVTTF